MWLGRQDLHNARVRFNLFRVSCMVWCVTELVSKAATQLLGDADLIALMDTEAMPPTPFYCIAASSLAIAIICASVSLLNHIPHSFFIRALISTGRLSLTIYVAHIFIGMGVLEALGFLGQQSIEVAVMSALVFCIAAMAFSVVWVAPVFYLRTTGIPVQKACEWRAYRPRRPGKTPVMSGSTDCTDNRVISMITFGMRKILTHFWD